MPNTLMPMCVALTLSGAFACASRIAPEPLAEQRVEPDGTSRRVLNDGNLVLEDVPEIPRQIVESLNRYQNVRAAGFLAWNAEGSSLYVSTRFGDVSQVHRIDAPGRARHQLT